MAKNRVTPSPSLPAPGPPPMTAEQVSFVILPRFNIATLTTLIDPPRIANFLAPQPLNAADALSADGTGVAASNGMSITAEPLSDRNRRGELVFVLASCGAEACAHRDLLAWLRRQAREGTRNRCSRAWLLCAGAGGDAGGGRGGHALTAPQRRTAGQGVEAFAPLLRQAITLLQQNIPETLTVPEIARHLGISQRQLEQLFQRGVGCSLVQFGTLVRLRHARVLVIATRLSVREIAAATGFSTPSHCAIAFRKRLGRGAREYLQGWPPGDPNPTWPGTPTGSLDILQERTARILHQGRRAGA